MLHGKDSDGGTYLYNGAVPAYYTLEDMWTGPVILQLNCLHSSMVTILSPCLHVG